MNSYGRICISEDLLVLGNATSCCCCYFFFCFSFCRTRRRVSILALSSIIFPVCESKIIPLCLNIPSNNCLLCSLLLLLLWIFVDCRDAIFSISNLITPDYLLKYQNAVRFTADYFARNCDFMRDGY
jgi:hypothetical protein